MKNKLAFSCNQIEELLVKRISEVFSIVEIINERNHIYIEFENQYLKDCAISFYEHMIQLFMTDDLVLMLIKDDTRKNMTSSDTSDYVVFNQSTSDMTQEEILTFIADIILLFTGVTDFSHTEEVLGYTNPNCAYPQCNYVVNICTELDRSETIVIGNVTFHIEHDKN